MIDFSLISRYTLDYNQYTVNQTVAVQQPNVKISEVNTKQYQKPKKVAVNEADKYNLNQDVQDYDIYENQVRRRDFQRDRTPRRTEAKVPATRDLNLHRVFSSFSSPPPHLLCISRHNSIRTSSAYPTASSSGKQTDVVR